jgi:asparagine synthase (glutamine-hydrolysing)
MFTRAERDELLAEGLRGQDPLARLRARWDESSHADDLARVLDLDLGTYLPDELLVKTDRASMAHSLEVRVPFLDRIVADFALALPSRHKVRGLSKKRLLREALAPVLPQEILDAPKHGFTLPAAEWLRGELEPYARELLSPAATAQQGVFRPEAVTRLLDDHVARRRDNWKQLWTLLSFAIWYDRYA